MLNNMQNMSTNLRNLQITRQSNRQLVCKIGTICTICTICTIYLVGMGDLVGMGK
jgi:hypothetical protein